MPKKTSRPEMSWIEARNQWRKRIKIGGRQRDIYGKTQDEVREQLRELRRQEEKGLVIGDSTTFAQFAKEWYGIKTATLKPKSSEVYQNALNNHIMPEFENIRLKDIRPLHVEKLMASKSEYSYESQKKILSTVKQIMKSAMKNGLITINPCEDFRAGGKRTAEKTPLTVEQQKIITETVKGKRMELFVLLCLYAGLRREEALGLMWSNVSLEEPAHIKVRHTVTFDRVGVPALSDTLKTQAAYRTIPIPKVLAKALKAAMRSGVTSLFVVPAMKTGGFMSLSSFRKLWRPVPKAVDFHVEPHLLRHTYITRLCSSGMDIKKIQYLAGHKDVITTLRIYTHVTNNQPEELAPMIARAFL